MCQRPDVDRKGTLILENGEEAGEDDRVEVLDHRVERVGGQRVLPVAPLLVRRPVLTNQLLAQRGALADVLRDLADRSRLRLNEEPECGPRVESDAARVDKVAHFILLGDRLVDHLANERVHAGLVVVYGSYEPITSRHLHC